LRFCLPLTAFQFAGLVDGHPNKTIGFDLGFNPHTIEIHRASVMTRMQSTSLSQLMRTMLLAAN
jgi:two-component system response regulator FixJ